MVRSSSVRIPGSRESSSPRARVPVRSASENALGGGVMFRRRLARITGVIGLVGCAACQRPSAGALAAGAVSGKTVVASIRAEPRSFNRYTTRDLTGVVIGYLTHSSLVRINRQTDRLEPELAEAWDLLPDA